MAQSDNVAHSHVCHLESCDNCLLYYMLRSKGDQEGSILPSPWHIYANPHTLHIRPVLSLAIYILAIPTATKETKLFESSDPYQQSSKVLRKSLDDD